MVYLYQLLWWRLAHQRLKKIPIELYFGHDQNQGYPHVVDLLEGEFSNYKLTIGFNDPDKDDEGVLVAIAPYDRNQSEYNHPYVLGVNENIVSS